MAQPVPIHSSVVAVDIERFSDPHRNDAVQTRIRRALYAILEKSFTAANVPAAAWKSEDRGDGAIIVVAPTVPAVLLLDSLVRWLSEALDEHNRTADLVEHFRLRFALHHGEVLTDEHGLVGAAVILACRLLDAEPLRVALRHARGNLAVIVSDRVYRDIVLPGYRQLDPATYHPVEVAVKSTRATAWIHVPGSHLPLTAGDRAEGPPAGSARTGGIHIEGTATGPRSTGVRIDRLELG